MTIHAYNPTYLSKAAKTLGNMLHGAVLEFGYDGREFLQLFIQSEIAEQVEDGNPKYIAGRSGLELFTEVIERTSGSQTKHSVLESYHRSDVYWVGWILAHYQWYSRRSFRDILEVVSYDELLGLYDTLHEADVRKAYEVLDMHFISKECKLKTMRKRCGLTQEELSILSEVSLNTIRAYERKSKDIKKAQADIVLRLVSTLRCNIDDILD